MRLRWRRGEKRVIEGRKGEGLDVGRVGKGGRMGMGRGMLRCGGGCGMGIERRAGVVAEVVAGAGVLEVVEGLPVFAISQPLSLGVLNTNPKST